MKPFHGFPAKMAFTPVPNLFLNRLMPQIEDMSELKTTLFIIMSIYSKKGCPRFVTFNELLGNVNLVESLKQSEKPAQEALADALELAVKRQTIFTLKIDSGSKTEDIYFLNTPADRRALEKLLNGEIKLPDIEASAILVTPNDERPDIFSLYEENIGMLTPMIADQLKEAEKLYPQSWIRDAIKKAVNQNKRKWDYISAILERWMAEGKSDEAYRRDSEKEDPDKYIKGKYGHMVRRR
jgi:DnaD/phage-associated family protein